MLGGKDEQGAESGVQDDKAGRKHKIRSSVEEWKVGFRTEREPKSRSNLTSMVIRRRKGRINRAKSTEKGKTSEWRAPLGWLSGLDPITRTVANSVRSR